MSSTFEIRNRMIGKSPEMPSDQSPGWLPAPRKMVSDDGRRAGAAYSKMPRQLLKQARLGPVDPEVMKLYLRLGPGERGGTIECA